MQRPRPRLAWLMALPALRPGGEPCEDVEERQRPPGGLLPPRSRERRIGGAHAVNPLEQAGMPPVELADEAGEEPVAAVPAAGPRPRRPVTFQEGDHLSRAVPADRVDSEDLRERLRVEEPPAGRVVDRRLLVEHGEAVQPRHAVLDHPRVREPHRLIPVTGDVGGGLLVAFAWPAGAQGDTAAQPRWDLDLAGEVERRPAPPGQAAAGRPLKDRLERAGTLLAARRQPSQAHHLDASG